MQGLDQWNAEIGSQTVELLRILRSSSVKAGFLGHVSFMVRIAVKLIVEQRYELL